MLTAPSVPCRRLPRQDSPAKSLLQKIQGRAIHRLGLAFLVRPRSCPVGAAFLPRPVPRNLQPRLARESKKRPSKRRQVLAIRYLPHVRMLTVMHTVRFNRRHRRSGHLFQGRFKAQLVEADEYAQGLVEYIHLNPVRPRAKASGSRRSARRSWMGIAGAVIGCMRGWNGKLRDGCAGNGCGTGARRMRRGFIGGVWRGGLSDRWKVRGRNWWEAWCWEGKDY